MRHDWPGNVRELSHVVQQAVLLAPGVKLMVEQFAGLIPVSAEAPSYCGGPSATASGP